VKYKKGNIVKVNRKQLADDYYTATRRNDIELAEGMLKHKEVTITSVHDGRYNVTVKNRQGLISHWTYVDKWLEPENIAERFMEE